MDSGLKPEAGPGELPVPAPGPVQGPPAARMPARVWIKENLFSTWYNGLLTVLGLWFVYVMVTGVLRWAVSTAEWIVVERNFTLLMVGTLPRTELWRVWACLLVVAVLSGASWRVWGRFSRQVAVTLAAALASLLIFPFSLHARLWILAVALAIAGGFLAGGPLRARAGAGRLLVLAWLVSFPAVLLMLHGLPASGVIPLVGTARWSGLLLTLLLAVAGIVVSFPFGVALALGRVSTLPVVRTLSILYIELVRGVPLVTVLFATQVMLPLFLPDTVRLDRVLRAMAGLVIFSAAYVAENVRGGLQAIPKGQIEAAQALGMNGLQVTVLIVLPQALRAVIPALVGQFISLFKDTSLVAIVGLQELLGVANSVLANPQYLGRYIEVYAFVALVYFVCSSAMSYASRRLEKSLGVGER